MTSQTQVNLTNLYNACDDAVANFLGTDDYDPAIVELVAARVACGLQKLQADDSFYSESQFETLLESCITYVQADCSHEDLETWATELDNQLDAYLLY